MSATPALADTSGSTPFFSGALFSRLTGIAVALTLATAGIAAAGRWYGERLALAGHSTSTETHDIFIGQDHLRLPGNVIRFAEQRATGVAERVDLYFTWPGMQGYTDDGREAFNDVSRPDRLLFVQISQSTMSRDMSGRIEPIYRHLFADAGAPTASGLRRHAMKETSGYGRETFFTADRPGQAPYAVRCLLPQAPALSTSADCQRDVHAGNDLVVLYRFSSQLLPQWKAMDDAILAYVEARIVR
ncbi:hypothetical protein [Ensifer soli]|uniref:hypothetical protein n=1 Tax=Ciceribacter sp. sgz301302 TaxID=3342379 RepID=UPI0035B70CFD